MLSIENVKYCAIQSKTEKRSLQYAGDWPPHSIDRSGTAVGHNHDDIVPTPVPHYHTIEHSNLLVINNNKMRRGSAQMHTAQGTNWCSSAFNTRSNCIWLEKCNP